MMKIIKNKTKRTSPALFVAIKNKLQNHPKIFTFLYKRIHSSKVDKESISCNILRLIKDVIKETNPSLFYLIKDYLYRHNGVFSFIYRRIHKTDLTSHTQEKMPRQLEW